MKATDSTILSIYYHFEYYLFVSMAKWNLGKCWFYYYNEDYNNLGNFCFEAVNENDLAISHKFLISFDKFMYKYHDKLVRVFQSHKGWRFDMSEYNYNKHTFDIIFEEERCFGTKKEVYGISDKGVVIKYNGYYDHYFDDFAVTLDQKHRLNYIYGLPSANRDLVKEYCINDLIATNDALKYAKEQAQLLPTIVPVPVLSKPPIFNDPATICYWNDGTKTIVKCQEGDTYSPEAGLALCYMKKILGNTSKDLNKELHKYIPEEKED